MAGMLLRLVLVGTATLLAASQGLTSPATTAVPTTLSSTTGLPLTTTTTTDPGSGQWVIADDGQACNVACARRGRLCSETNWPANAEDLRQVALQLGQPCEDVQSGDVGYDPSREGAYCGWRGNVGVPEEGHETRCSIVPPWSTQRFCFCEGVLVTTTLPFDCLSGLSDDNGASWPPDKRQWCCTNQGLGCTTTPAPYNCHSGGEEAWSPAKKEWCCHHQHRGCQTTSTTILTTTVKDPFDCHTDLIAWSAPKKDWCCKHLSLGCTTAVTTTTIVTTTKPFNCNTEESSWASGQREWCCKHESKGCPRPAPGKPPEDLVAIPQEETFDCQAGYAHWQRGWSDAKKEWCCDNRGLGCKFNCVAGYSNWRIGWSDAKKEWCCQHQHLGCDAYPL